MTHPNIPRGVHTGPGLTAGGSICMHSPPRTRRTLRTYLMHQARGSRVSAFLLSSPSLNTDFLRARAGGKRFSVRGECALSGLGPHAQEHADSTCSPRRGRGKVLFSVCTEQLVASARGPQPSWTDRPAEEQVASADARECLPAERGQRCRQGFAGHTQEPPHDYMRTGLFSLGRDSLPPADKLRGGTTCLSHDPRRDPARAGLRALLALRALAAQRTEHRRVRQGSALLPPYRPRKGRAEKPLESGTRLCPARVRAGWMQSRDGPAGAGLLQLPRGESGQAGGEGRLSFCTYSLSFGSPRGESERILSLSNLLLRCCFA